MKPPVRHCAIYTRKSSDEGLEQEFNSLDAQREACHAYILSQKSEGWLPTQKIYDDGGFSRGNMERPGLRELLLDIRSGAIHIVVVYKIDRLTRALTDFVKLVEVFDQHGVTFVSVTQSFNTTTSMGRLTLNVLLSFAQFEREITSERIRDKIAATKKKGMRSGGMTPVGYDLVDKKLVPNEEYAAFTRMLYERYLELGSIAVLRDDLKRRNIKSPVRLTKHGKKRGDCYYTRGALEYILSNPVFIGKIQHKDKIYDGIHPPILPEELWYRVQDKMKQSLAEYRETRRIAAGPRSLQGKIRDTEGRLYYSHRVNKDGNKYHHYCNEYLTQYREHPKHIIARIPADEIETFVHDAILDLLRNEEAVRGLFRIGRNKLDIPGKIASEAKKLTDLASGVQKVVIDTGSLLIVIKLSALCAYISTTLNLVLKPPEDKDLYEIRHPYTTIRAFRGITILPAIPSACKRRLRECLPLSPLLARF